MNSISIIGDGAWGTSLALLLQGKGVKTVLWSYSPEYAEYLNKHRCNTKFLDGVALPEDLEITSELDVAGKNDIALFAVPCEYLRPVLKTFSGAGFSDIVSATKGIENDTFKRPSEIIDEYFAGSSVSVLSGPSISYEVANKYPAAVVLASKDDRTGDIQKLLSTDYFRVYTSSDVVGVEIGGALKNIIAIASGVSDGLGFGANTKAAILTRGLAEIKRMGVSLGAEPDTFSGLSGVGDLATTCISGRSRNRWFGEEIGKGRSAEEILKSTESVVEGISTVRSVYGLSIKKGIDMPITKKIYEIVYEKKDVRSAIKELMTRELKDE